MDLYSKAVEFLKMKKHICAGNFFNIGLHVCVIYASDDRIFIGCSSGNDESEYNTFLEMKTISPQLYIKKIICVDEYECVYLPSMKFIDYIVSDNEKNSEAFVFVDVSHVRPVYSFIQNKRITPSAFFTSPVMDEWQDNNAYRNNNAVQNNNIVKNNTVNRNAVSSDNSPQNKNNFISTPADRKNDNLKSYADIDFNDNFADGFEDSSEMENASSRPVIVMKRENKNAEPENQVNEIQKNTSYKADNGNVQQTVSDETDKVRIKHKHKEKNSDSSSLSMGDVKKFASAAKNFFTKPL